MSDTTQTAAAPDTTAPAPEPENPVTISAPRQVVWGGIEHPVRTVSFGKPARSLEMRELDEADQWDISEMAGANQSENLAWMSRTMAAWCIVQIDGVPVPTIKTANDIRNRLRQLGRDGVGAAMQGLAASIRDDAPKAAALDVAKN